MKDIYDIGEIVREEYREKMLHTVPIAPVINREQYILEKVKDKIVLDLGASGPLHEAVKQVANYCYGIDINAPQDKDDYYNLDFDKVDALPELKIEIILAGEIIEHVDNAGHFLELLKPYQKPIILTTPNAFGVVGYSNIKFGIESVNIDHKCWYSYTTLKTLVEKYGYNIKEFYWYNGKPYIAEGMIFLLEC